MASLTEKLYKILAEEHAYGMARGEDPYEVESSACARALEAAREAFTKWGGDRIFTTEAYRADRAERPMATGEQVA